MKKIKLILFGVILLACFWIMENKSYAATSSASLSVSSTTVSPGTAVSVSASIINAESYSLSLSGKGLSGNLSAADAFGTERSQQVLSGTFKMNEPGTYTITLSGSTASTEEVNSNRKMPISKSVSITVKESSNGGNSSNNGGSTNNGGNTNTGNGGTTDSAPTLSNLGIRPNDFSGFKPGKKEYSVTVPADCTSIEVYASSKNGTVSGTGTKTLKNGTNRFDVTVTNGSKKTTYTILVTKKSDEDGETPPNTIDEENQDETIQEGIGLASLEIEGYTLDKEFKTDVYEYIVKVNKQLTLEDLEAIKGKVKAVANTENVTVDIATNVSEDKVSTIVITVKDEEKEYAKYVVTFEVKKENTKVAGIIKNNSNSPTIGMFGLTEEQQIYAILGGIGITTFLAIVFACVSYAKSRRIAEYEEEDDEYEEENSDFEKMNQYYIGMENAKTEEEPTLDRSSEITSEPSIAETIEDTATSLRKTNGYRKLSRGRRSYGKH